MWKWNVHKKAFLKALFPMVWALKVRLNSIGSDLFSVREQLNRCFRRIPFYIFSGDSARVVGCNFWTIKECCKWGEPSEAIKLWIRILLFQIADKKLTTIEMSYHFKRLTKSKVDVLFRGANSKSKVGRFLDQKVKEEKEISKKLERVRFQH